MLTQTSRGWQTSNGMTGLGGLGNTLATSAFTITGANGAQKVSYTDSTGRSVTIPLPSTYFPLSGPVTWYVNTYGSSADSDVDFLAVPVGAPPPTSSADQHSSANTASAGLNIAQLIQMVYGEIYSPNGWPKNTPTMPKGWGFNGTGFGFPPTDHLEGTPGTATTNRDVYLGPPLPVYQPPPVAPPQSYSPANPAQSGDLPPLMGDPAPPNPALPYIPQATSMLTLNPSVSQVTPVVMDHNIQSKHLARSTPAAPNSPVSAPSAATSFFSSMTPQSAPAATAPVSTVSSAETWASDNWMLIAAGLAALYLMTRK